MQAKISEIFLSYQGEGPFMGSRQLFVRFYGCNIQCSYCDTPLESFKTFSKEDLLGKVLDFGDDYNELVLTGGEPLLYADFVKEFLILFRKHRPHRTYLETNGTLPVELEKVIDQVDIMAMDVKLPSSTGYEEDLWARHESFMKVASRKELVVKAIITGDTTMDDVKRMGEIVREVDGDMTLVLQPATPVNEDVEHSDNEMLGYFKGHLEKETKKTIMVVGQMHKCLGIK